MIKVIAYYEGYAVGHEMLCVDERDYENLVASLFMFRSRTLRGIVRIG